MQLTALDWIVVAASLIVAFSPAVFFARRAGKGTAEFFASGRAAPWWLIGISMVATTFSTDTPNLVTNFVRTGGVAKNWAWWAFLLTGMLTVFFYARLWRRSGVLTDLEFYELRYSGRSASFVRGFRAIYLGLFANCIIMAAVTLAAAKIAGIMLGWSQLQTVVFCALVCIVFASLAGLWGVLVTDVIQFTIAMVGVTVAAVVALQRPEVGGLSGLLAKVDPSKLRLLPDFTDRGLTLEVLVIPLAVQWWSVWYPGSEPGGGSYIAQRMLAAKNEVHALGATLCFNVAHYALRPWPWLIVALASLLVFPELSDIKAAFPHVSPKLIGDDIAYPAMLTLLPAGALGLLVASLLAAYVSTMSTHLNWGASYLVHDFYRRFVRPEANERECVLMGRLVTAGLMILAGSLMFLLGTAKDAFDLLLSVGAGTGLIYLLRWFWWRVNAWSEIAAMISSFTIAAVLFAWNKVAAGYPNLMEVATQWGLTANVAITTLVWVSVTYLTAPTDHGALVRFYRLVRPAGRGWRHIRQAAGGDPSPDSLPNAFLAWTLGCVFVYAALFGTGGFLLRNWLLGGVCLVLFLISGAWLALLLPRIWRARLPDEAATAATVGGSDA